MGDFLFFFPYGLPGSTPPLCSGGLQFLFRLFFGLLFIIAVVVVAVVVVVVVVEEVFF